MTILKKGKNKKSSNRRDVPITSAPVPPVPQRPPHQHQRAIQELMATLRSPSSHNQEAQILHILKSNPPLMASFIEQRQRAQQQTPGGSKISTLRRARFSTLCKIWDLHNQGTNMFMYPCNKCEEQVETRYHCTECNDFNLCVPCYENHGHPHMMEKLGLDLDLELLPGDTRTSNQEAHGILNQRGVQSLVHVCQCKDANCCVPSCQKIKRVIVHYKNCQRTKEDCSICKALLALCCCHAKHCQDTKCSVQFCSIIKQDFKQSQLQQRLQLLRRQMSAMNTRGLAPGQSSRPSTSAIVLPTQTDSAAPQPTAASIQHTHQKALQALMAVLRSPTSYAQKQPQIMHILKSNPPLMAAFIKQRQQKAQNQQQAVGLSSLGDLSLATGDVVESQPVMHPQNLVDQQAQVGIGPPE